MDLNQPINRMKTQKLNQSVEEADLKDRMRNNNKNHRLKITLHGEVEVDGMDGVEEVVIITITKKTIIM